VTGAVRRDDHLGTVVHVVAHRQHRPNLPETGCPFCVGGLEAPDLYVTRAFPNRWPPLAPGRCEVILYSPDHDASLATIGAPGVREVVDLWAERTEALLGDPEVDYVLVFENRGREIGATIDHPHGQIYAFDHVPARPLALVEAGWQPERDPGPRSVVRHGSWNAWVNRVPIHPLSIMAAPSARIGRLTDLDDAGRDDLAHLLVDVLSRCDALWETPIPYMMWIHQAPRSRPDAWMHIEIVSPWRDEGVPRFIAAAEVATGEYFNPVDPDDLAARLRGAR
jgi:UDPglucose--hexose-1-phosphate uridylyltransferase